MQASLWQEIERRRAAPAKYPEGRFEGRGIVICAGGTRYFTCAWVLIFILQNVHRTSLPIQVWHLGRREMSEEMRLLLQEKGVEVVDAETVVARHPARLAGGWPLKPYAIAHSRFREVLYLDADTVPIGDPAAAFEWDEYRQSGLLLWPDSVDIKKTNPIWSRLNMEATDHVSVDSGILAVDKARSWDVLDLAVLMNEHWSEIYDVLYGDKDTFPLSARLIDRGIGMVSHRPFVFECDFVQRDPAGEPFLHHRTASKWQLNQANRPLPDPSLMSNCEAALAELRSRWSGRVFHPPERSLEARAEEARLIARRTFKFEPATGGPLDIELLPGGCIRAPINLARHWAVVDRDGAQILQFYASTGPTETFERLCDGSWRGTSREPGFEILLTEYPAGAAIMSGAGRPYRSAEHPVASLGEPALFAAGYDEARASALAAALSLLNDIFDDVPEQIDKHLTRHAASLQWRDFLGRLVSKLTGARDGRIAMLRTDKNIGPRTISSVHYARPDST